MHSLFDRRQATPALTLTPALKEPTNAPPPKFPLRTHLIHDIALQPRTVAKLAEMYARKERGERRDSEKE